MKTNVAIKDFRNAMFRLQMQIAGKLSGIEEYENQERLQRRNGNTAMADFLKLTGIPDLRKEVNHLEDLAENYSQEFRDVCASLSLHPPLEGRQAEMTAEEFWSDIDQFINDRAVKKKSEAS